MLNTLSRGCNKGKEEMQTQLELNTVINGTQVCYLQLPSNSNGEIARRCCSFPGERLYCLKCFTEGISKIGPKRMSQNAP